MIEMVNEKGWIIENCNLKGDEEEEFVFIGARDSLVIDYVIVNEKLREKVRVFKMKERMESDRAPLSVWLFDGEGNRKEEKRGRENGREKSDKEVYSWKEENIKACEE